MKLASHTCAAPWALENGVPFLDLGAVPLHVLEAASQAFEPPKLAMQLASMFGIRIDDNLENDRDDDGSDDFENSALNNNNIRGDSSSIHSGSFRRSEGSAGLGYLGAATASAVCAAARGAVHVLRAAASLRSQVTMFNRVYIPLARPLFLALRPFYSTMSSTDSAVARGATLPRPDLMVN